MNLLIDSIRASARRSLASRCPATGKVVKPPAFATFRGDAILADPDRHAPELAKIAALIPPDAVPSAGELANYGILARTPGCKLSTGGEVFEPRPFDVASVGGTAVGRWLTVAEAAELAPNLAAALHAYFGTQPAPRVAPPATCRPTLWRGPSGSWRPFGSCWPPPDRPPHPDVDQGRPASPPGSPSRFRGTPGERRLRRGVARFLGGQAAMAAAFESQ